MTRLNRTILYLTPNFSPATTAAALRAENFVNALRHSGFTVIVATAGPDPTVKNISDNLILYRVSPSGRLPAQINAQHLPRWPYCKILPGPSPGSPSTKSLYRLCSHLIAEHQIDLFFATAPPFSFSALAHILTRTHNLPLVLEFRDAWFTGMPWPYTSFLQRRSGRHWERQCVLDADRVITVTDSYRRILIDTYGDNLTEKITTVRHGYIPLAQPSALENPSCPPTDENRCFTIAYTGQLRGIDIASLTPLKRTLQAVNHAFRRFLLGARFCEKLNLDWMSPHYLLAALAGAARENPDFARSVRLVFAGEKFPEIDRWARELNLSANVRQLGPLPHDQAQKLTHQADLLVLTLYGIKDCPYHWCVPSKIYSYLATGKPVLALVPPGEAADIVTKAGTGIICRPDEISEITRQLLDAFHIHQKGMPIKTPHWDYIEQFELIKQQEIFIDSIRAVINR